MTLKDYLAQGTRTAAELASETGLSGASISRLATGLQKPTLATMALIADATDGHVMPNDWLPAQQDAAA